MSFLGSSSIAGQLGRRWQTGCVAVPSGLLTQALLFLPSPHRPTALPPRANMFHLAKPEPLPASPSLFPTMLIKICGLVALSALTSVCCIVPELLWCVPHCLFCTPSPHLRPHPPRPFLPASHSRNAGGLPTLGLGRTHRSRLVPFSNSPPSSFARPHLCTPVCDFRLFSLVTDDTPGPWPKKTSHCLRSWDI